VQLRIVGVMDSYQFAKICELLRDILNAESQQSTKICEKLSEIMRKLEHFQMQIEDCRHHTIECTMEQRRRGFDVCGRGFARQNGVMESGEGEDEVD
jgi:hypothetical protein